MFKWPDVPSPGAEEHEIADFAELLTWRDGGTSALELTRSLSRLDEADYSDGVPEEDEIDARVETVFLELERRCEACAGGYPFIIGDNGQTARTKKYEGENSKQAIYKYLLLATRLNMNHNRLHSGFDGAQLFEEVSAESARCYLGGRSKSLVFGTAAHGDGFAAKVEDLCKRIGEGGGFVKHSGGRLRPRDGKLDVVAWTPFSDRQSGELIVFGQCKTGTHYKDHLAQLQPDAFCNKWFRSQPVVMPTRTFFVTEALPRSQWRDWAVDAGLLFDRCRIVDFSDAMSADVVARLQAWTDAAAAAVELPASSR